MSKTKSRADRKNSWVMLAEAGGYTPLPGEQTLYVSPPRTTLSGVVYLTNRRVIYLPVTPTPELQSFAVPILNVADSRVTAPWFGANKWEAVIQPVFGGGIPAHHAELELTMEFREGGAFDFATTFERLKDRLKQAVEVARESGLATGDGAELGGGQGGGALAGVNLNSVHLEDLPAYEESGQHPVVHPSDQIPASSPIGGDRRDSQVATSPESAVAANKPSSPLSSPQQESFQPPSEPPPGYEEVQRESVADELERRLRIHDDE
ncbi:WW-domain ligand protein-domain-containing protein [Clohesyomyces aquaticus]|uniref:WW-domain ligand protein-domain-containing protein n=1 Tax=Clohesyomyces aquaticus TaxID=1231657 RepID=A0A1Y1ZXW1_9PLEO|nr:WW-domain ligand protein-domain-containing protein [Clohesyomyces aquaticus]